MGNVRTSRRRAGNSMVEAAFVMPFFIFLFLGVFDFGFYAYALICVENGARAAAMHTSTNGNTDDDSEGACRAALEEMKGLPNVPRTLACPACAFGSSCTVGPLSVTATAIPAGASADGLFPASRVAMRYQTIPLFPIPGMAGQFTINRTVEMRRRN